MALVNDPVCGMVIDSDFAPLYSTRGIDTYFFCSEACRQEFGADPERFTGLREPRMPPAPERKEPPYTTSGKFTAPKLGSAGSGGAEYEPLPNTHGEEE